MKKFLFYFVFILMSFSVSAQVTFNWEAQYISEGNNIKGLNIVNDTCSVLVGYGRTFMKSADQGETWKSVPLLTPKYDFEDISINSSGLGYACARDVKVVDNPSTGEPDVYADGVLLKTTDHGATWMVVDITELGSGEGPLENPNEIGAYAMHFRSVEVLEDNSVFLGVEWYFYESAANPREGIAGMLRTTDGATWSSVADGGNYPMAIEASTNTVYYGGLNHLFKADASTGVASDIYENLTTAAGDLTVFVNDFEIVNEDLVFVITSMNGIYVTKDQGATFSLLDGTDAPTGGNDMLVVNDTVWLVLGTSARSLITRDSGLNWTEFYPGSTCYEIGGILNDTILGLGKSNIYKLAVADAIAGNNIWSSQEITFNENLQKMHITDADNAIIVGYGQTLVSTSDAGLSWNDVVLPELFVYGASYDFEAVSTADNVSYAISKRFYMVDYPSSEPISDVFAHGLIYKSMDLWNSWELLDVANVGTGDDPALNPNATDAYGLDLLVIHALNDSVVFMGARWLDSIAGYEDRGTHSNIFKSEDGGDSWEQLFDDQGSLVFNQILFLDDNIGYFLGNSFFMRTEDGGETFSDLYPAFQESVLPNDPSIFLNQMVYVDENTWYLLSSVDGLFVTYDGGTSYSLVSGIGGGGGMHVLNDTTIIVLGSSTKSKISWDKGESWNNCYPGSTIWSIGGILNDELVALAKTNIYKIPLADLEAPSEEADILTFILSEQTGDASIDASANTVNIEVATGTDVSALIPTIRVSEGAKISPASEVATDFTSPVSYTVTAEDTETTEVWTVTVTIQVGMTEKSLDKIIMYPNPAKEKLFLQSLQDIDHLAIFSISGSSVLNMDVLSERLEIGLDDFENGVYFITFFNKDGAKVSKKFVINR